MESDRRARVELLYRSALECERVRRGAFLAGACGGDDELRGEVENLLESSGTESRNVNQFEILEKIGQGRDGACL